MQTRRPTGAAFRSSMFLARLAAAYSPGRRLFNPSNVRGGSGGSQVKRIRHVLALSDLHCGSTVGLCPPNFRMAKGGTYGLNKSQQWLWRQWLDLTEKAIAWIGDNPFALVVNGDLIEGNHHGTTEIWSVNMVDHVNAAIEALEPISKKADKTFVVVGTECHTREHEYGIAEYLKADPNDDAPAWDQLNLKLGSYPTRFVHHTSTTSREWLRASRLSIQLTQARSAAHDAGHEAPKMLVAGHCHLFDCYQRLDLAAVTLPAWQLLTRHGHKVVPGSVPAVGCVVMDFTDSVPRIKPFVTPGEKPRSVAL